jgi:hypothetical protein
MGFSGGVFFRAADGIDARKLIAKVCDGGKVVADDARAASGTAVVGFAVHPPRGGFWAIVDSADGALGIAEGGWSSVSIAANHLSTDAIWARVYTPELALAVYYPRGATRLRAYAGTAAEVVERLVADGAPVNASPPRDAGDDALLAAVAYEPGKYGTGPDAELAGQLLALHHALAAGDGDRLRAAFDALAERVQPLALGIVRGADRGEWRAAVQGLAREIVGQPPRKRPKAKQVLLDEEVLRLAAELASDGAARAPLLDHLDAIELEAETSSAHAHPDGVAVLADALGRRGDHAGAVACLVRLLRRPEPAWYTCNAGLAALLAKPGELVLDT